MMGTCSSEEEEDRFFDTREDLTSVSDSGSDCPDSFNFGSSPGVVDRVSNSFGYEVWIRNPDSVHDRRHKFFKWMGINLDRTKGKDPEDLSGAEFAVEIERITEDSGAVLGNSCSEDGFSSSRSSMSCWSSSDTRDFSEGRSSEDTFVCRIKNLDDGTEFIVDELEEDGTLSKLREVGSNRLVTIEEFQSTLGLSPLLQRFMRREADAVASNSLEPTKRVTKAWLRKLRSVACIVDRQGRCGTLNPSSPGLATGGRVQRVKVSSCKKRCKELSALYMGQDIKAHEGLISTMKFSLGGQYLASAGKDGIVRVWQVMERERSNEVDILDIDPSCVYFTVNNFSELAPLFTDKEKLGKFRSLRTKSDSDCIIFPPRVFRISEKPLHQFHGHIGEILDLSWSKNKYLLSSSIDKTVRLWQVGCNQCLKVFSHNNYVTCVQFNPVDDNHFISGSIDGKVRIWSIPDCHVVDWTDIREIVTAVCYRPDGQGVIVGSMTGNCRFYDASDNHLQLDAQICLQGKKKYPGKRVTGFQFSPGDPSKLMVTSADSQVRILDGVDVICKYRGLRNAGSRISASFTSDGKHIVSASEDSKVYIWDSNSQDEPASSYSKSIWSCERFFSDNVSVAIPWCGMRSGNALVSASTRGTHPSRPVSGDPPISSPKDGWHHGQFNENSHNTPPLTSPDRFSLSHGFFAEALPKGSATWPEEKLPSSNSLTASSPPCKSQYKFLKSSCQCRFTSHAWGLVIVTAGCDGRIRSFHSYGLPICH